MKNVSVILSVLFLAGCAGAPSGRQEESWLLAPAEWQAERKLMSVELPGPAGATPMGIDFDEKGNWVRITSTGSAEVADQGADSAATTETAYLVATLRAKRSLAAFLASDLRSTRTVKRIARAQTSGSGASGASEGADDTVNERTERVAAVLVERISEQTSAILRGVQVVRRTHHSGSVNVEVAATRASIAAASDLARRMGGGT